MFHKELGKYTKAHRTIKRREEEENDPPRINLPATLFNRSPQKLLTNTSTLLSSKKLGTPLRARVVGLSPMRNQFESLTLSKNQNIEYNYQSTPSILKSKILNSSQKSIRSSLSSSYGGMVCQNQTHKDRPATFLVISNQQQKLPYCQKCAILLASQGFTVTRMNKQPAEPPRQKLTIDHIKRVQRRGQITSFLSQVEQTIAHVTLKKQLIKESQFDHQQHLQQSQQQIHNYFNSLQGIIQSHRAQMLSKLRQPSITKNTLSEAQEIIDSCQRIKEDIVGSISNINNAENRVYSGIMSVYWDKLEQYSNVVLTHPEEWRKKRVVVGDMGEVKRGLESVIRIGVEQVGGDDARKQSNKSSDKSNKSDNRYNQYFSFDNGMNEEEEKCLEDERKWGQNLLQQL